MMRTSTKLKKERLHHIVEALQKEFKNNSEFYSSLPPIGRFVFDKKQEKIQTFLKYNIHQHNVPQKKIMDVIDLCFQKHNLDRNGVEIKIETLETYSGYPLFTSTAPTTIIVINIIINF